LPSRIVASSAGGRRNPTHRGVVVALSGVDCAGKSTQCELMGEGLRALGYELRTIWSRAGYTPGLKAAKALARRFARRKLSDRTGVSESPSKYPRRASNLPKPLQRWLWITSALLDLLWLYGVQIRLWKRSGAAVLCDRYLLDCLVDFRVNFPNDHIEDRLLFRLLRRVAVKPDLAVCLLVPAEWTAERSREKERFHWESMDVLQERYECYRDLCGELGVAAFDGLRPSPETAEVILSLVETGLGGPGRHPARS